MLTELVELVNEELDSSHTAYREKLEVVDTELKSEMPWRNDCTQSDSDASYLVLTANLTQRRHYLTTFINGEGTARVETTAGWWV